MKKAFLLVLILFVSVVTTACINNFAVQELNNKAKMYLEQGDYDNAISRLKSSIDLDNSIFETHYNLGIAYTQAEKYPQAVETFNNAINLKPNFPDTYYSLGVAQENYAKGIMDGSLRNVDLNAEKNEIKSQIEDVEAGQPVVLTQQEKDQINQLLNAAIIAYQNYVAKGQNVEDKQEVEQKIESLKTQALKYSSQLQQQQ